MNPPAAVRRPRVIGGFRAFQVLWAGQSISFLGSEISGFALGVWVYQTTGSVASFALTLLAALVPGLLVSPLAGVIVDRTSIRRILVLADAGSSACMVGLLALLLAGRLEFWHVLVAQGIASVLVTFQMPAVSSATTLLVPGAHLGRASGMLSSGEAAARTLGPLLAGLLIGPVGLAGIILIDVVTLLLGLSALALIRIPPVRANAGGEPPGAGFRLEEIAYGWQYIARRPGLVRLVAFGFIVNLGFGTAHTLLTPTLLDLSSPAVLGTIMSAAGVAMLVGSAVLGAWGGPRRRIHGFFAAGGVIGVAFLVAGVRPQVATLGAGFILLNLALPFLNGSTQPIWQTKTPIHVQGRVFAIRLMLGRASFPLAFLVAPGAAEACHRLLLRVDGPLASLTGPGGVGPQHGVGALFVLAGGAVLAALLACALTPQVRRIEDLLPDCPPDGEPAGSEEPAAAPIGEVPALTGS